MDTRNGRWILCRNGEGRVSFKDYERIMDLDFIWYVWRSKKNTTAYLVAPTTTRYGKATTVFLHRILMNAPDSLEVNHINFNGTDNRRSNLELCTRRTNAAHRQKLPKSGYQYITKTASGYSIRILGKHISSCKTIEEAIAIRDAVIKRAANDNMESFKEKYSQRRTNKEAAA